MTQQTWLTQEAYDRLRSELEYLTGTWRTEIATKIEAAREEGDLRENGGYHAAKEEQGKQEARIRQLMDLLRDARVGETAPAVSGEAGPGMIVEIRFPGEKETEKFLIGSREDHSTSIEVFSPASPLGGAVTGHKAGETVNYTLPNGRSAAVEIVAVSPYAG
ncbi:transcription elongation factor GreA [Parafrankia sp. EUN1f]|uniref:transcription elongation factor GreA n=1 Tax=Parafrankia sp. EUN1f TaxID=102897 RepID=UPI0001C442C6|nr:transcription elongation factor GreA [Parafrankia sp. EUN1f]EFC84855.1 transcription elongation factor GreA [Parafrankia sp. EUN1f]